MIHDQQKRERSPILICLTAEYHYSTSVRETLWHSLWNLQKAKDTGLTTACAIVAYNCIISTSFLVILWIPSTTLCDKTIISLIIHPDILFSIVCLFPTV